MADVFSGKTGRNTAIWTANKAEEQLKGIEGIYKGAEAQAGNYLTTAFGQGQDYLKNAFKGSNQSINQGYGAAQGYLGDGITGALDQSNAGYQQGRNDINGALTTATGQVQQGYGDALQSIGSLYGQAEGTQQQAVDAWSPLVKNGMAGYDMYNNSLGLNGAEGNTAARDAFQAGPGYDWQVGQATDAAARQANKMGGSALGGNSLNEITRLGSNLANQEYGSWQDRLQGFQGAATTAVQGQAGALTGLAGLYQDQGRDTSQLQVGQGKDLAGLTTAAGTANAGLAQSNGQFNAGIVQTGSQQQAQTAAQQAQQLAALRSQYGLNQTNLTTQYGGAMAGLTTGTAQGIADSTNNYYNTVTQAGQQGLQAGQQAAANRTGALLGGAQLVASAAGAAFGAPVAGGGSFGGNLLSSLFGK